MKKMLLLCALLLLSLGWFHASEIAKMKSELAAAREKVAVVEQQRVPRAALARAQAAMVAAQEKTTVLQQELTGTKEQLAVSQERVKTMERRLSLQSDKAPEAGSSLGLVKGTYTLLEDTMIYSPDAQLKVGNNVLISSPTGLMLSDKEQETVAGDLAVDTPSGTMQATHAFIDVNGGKIQMTADSMSFTNK